jgi:hypothetical protein
MTDPPTMFSPGDVARLLSVNAKTVTRWCRDGRLAAVTASAVSRSGSSVDRGQLSTRHGCRGLRQLAMPLRAHVDEMGTDLTTDRSRCRCRASVRTDSARRLRPRAKRSFVSKPGRRGVPAPARAYSLPGCSLVRERRELLERAGNRFVDGGPTRTNIVSVDQPAGRQRGLARLTDDDARVEREVGAL